MSEQYIEVHEAGSIARKAFAEGFYDAIAEIADAFPEGTEQYRNLQLAVVDVMLEAWSGTESRLHEACVTNEAPDSMEVEQ